MHHLNINTMKRNPNDPDEDKAKERMNEFNRQRQAVPADNKDAPVNAGAPKAKITSTPANDKKVAGTDKINKLKSPKK